MTLDLSLPELIAVVAAMAGAAVSVYDGYLNREDGQGFSKKKLLSALITSITGSLLLINFGVIADEANSMSLIGFIVAYFVIGLGTDRGLARLDKSTGLFGEFKNGEVARQNMLKQMDSVIDFCEKDVQNTQKELEEIRSSSWPDVVKNWYVPRLEKELEKSKQLLAEKIQWKHDVMNSYGWHN